MAFSPGSDAVITVNSVDLSEFLTGFNFDTKRETMRKKVLGNNPDVVVPLTPATSGTMDGLLDETAIAAFQTFMEDDTPASLPLTYAPQGVSGITWAGVALFSNFHVESPSDDLSAFSVDWDINGTWLMT
jgi:hypothetical protein